MSDSKKAFINQLKLIIVLHRTLTKDSNLWVDWYIKVKQRGCLLGRKNNPVPNQTPPPGGLDCLLKTNS